jgi:hypothetical protein
MEGFWFCGLGSEGGIWGVSLSCYEPDKHKNNISIEWGGGG